MRYRLYEAVRNRRPEEVERRAAEPQPEPVRPRDPVLALQRAAGNRAVSALLARAPDTAAPAGEKGAKAAGAHASLPGIGTIALLSVELGVSRPGGAPGGPGAPAPSEIVLSSRLGAHSAQLTKAAQDGKPMDVEIVIPHGNSVLRLTLKGAVVSSYSVAGDPDGPIESWALTFSAIHYGHEDEQGKSQEKRRDGGWWDDDRGIRG